ncbi:MFS transporter [Saccharothrix sp. ALI-22-I]|uniref:MFS transporter n=1 Tax=Saccharothrix sp. ALI-22-I TaxID=1933778 RepID=UPI001EE6B6D3|nr:MFS transporter [Saccharothrix sp. ALI-22-I]
MRIAMMKNDTAVVVAEAPRTRQAGVTQLVLLLAGSCMAVLGSVLIAPVLPQMTAEFADTPGVDLLVPVALTVPALMIGLAAPFAGLVVDAVDRKRLLLVGMVLYAVLGTAPLYLDSLGAIVATRVGVGLCEAAIMTCCTTLIGDYWSGARRSRYLGLQTLVAAVAATVFFAVGGLLGASGWRTPFWLYAVALVIVVPMAFLLWQPARPAGVRRRLEPLPWRVLAGPCAVSFLGGVWFYTLIVELSFVLTGLGIGDPGTIGAVSAGMSLATAAGAVLFGRTAGRGPRVLLPVEFVLTAAGMGLVAVAGSLPVVAVGAVLTGLGTGMLLPTLLTWAMNRLDFGQRGRGTGIWTGSLFIGQFLCPLLIAAVAALTGGLQASIGVLGVAAAVMAVVTFLALRGNDEALDAEAPQA